MASLRRKLIQLMSLKKESGGGGGLPSEYQQVEYIASSGGYPATLKQYIITDYIPNANTGYEIEYKTPTGKSNSYEALFGASFRVDGAYKVYAIRNKAWDNENGLSFYVDGQAINLSNVTYGVKHNFSIDKNRNYNLDGITGQLTYTADYPTTFNPNMDTAIFIFAQGNKTDYVPATTASAEIYKLKFYENNVLVRDFVPCYRKSDGEIGMFEIVNQVFYTNQGTGAFTKGPDVN